MANGLNKCLFIGNLGQDPEIRYSQSGAAVCNFSLACNERRKDGDEWVEHTEWVRFVAFGKTAENIGQYKSKGDQLYVEGRMQTRKYQDKAGVDKWSTEIVANQVLFIGSRSADGQGQGQSQPKGNGGSAKRTNTKQSKQYKPPANKKTELDNGFYDDDLPF